MRFIASILVCGLLASCSSPAPSEDVAKGSIEVPITLRHGLPTVHVLVADAPFDLFLDLGGHNAISLTADELAKAPVRYLPSTDRYQNALGEVFTARRFVAPAVVVGGFAVGELEGGEYVLPKTGGPPDRNGYLGKGFLTRYLIVLDYPNKRVRLYQPGDAKAFLYECGVPQFGVFNIDGVIGSWADTEYGRLSFQWDTGATHNFLRPSVIGAAAARARKIDEGSPVLSIASIDLGQERIGPLDFRLLQFSAPSVDATFGTGLFASRKVCLDFSMGLGAVI
jgi:hypothetical protein